VPPGAYPVATEPSYHPRRCAPSRPTIGDNALAESFVGSFKSRLITDRVWRSRSQLELAIVECFGWFNHIRAHQALGDVWPGEFEAPSAARTETITSTITNEEPN
jgi:transposase InsO family protein